MTEPLRHVEEGGVLLGQYKVAFVTLTRDIEKTEPRLAYNLEETLGHYSDSRIEWRVFCQDGNKLDIFQGYNAALALTEHYPYLCFLHDDVELLCNIRPFLQALKLLEKPLIGFVGPAGTRHLPASAAWWQAPQDQCRGLVAHPFQRDGQVWNSWPHVAAQFGPVAVLDGLLLMCRREVLLKLGGFDEGYYQGFHMYDLDITMRATLKGYVNHTTPLPLLHRSHGKPNDNWEQNRQRFLTRYGEQLPYQLK